MILRTCSKLDLVYWRTRDKLSRARRVCGYSYWDYSSIVVGLMPICPETYMSPW